MTLSTRRVVLATAVAFSTLFSAGVAAAEAIKVAAIYTLPVEQQWISRIHKALNAAARPGRDRISLFSENVANNDYERVMREYAEQGQQLIVGEVFGSGTGRAQGCQGLPRNRVSDGVVIYGPVAPNFSVFRQLDPRTKLSVRHRRGCSVTKTIVIGMVGGYAIPEVNRLNARLHGWRARSRIPMSSLWSTFFDSWYDPPKAKESAFAMMDAGADIMYAERFGVSDAAVERGVKAIGNVIDTAADYPGYNPRLGALAHGGDHRQSHRQCGRSGRFEAAGLWSVQLYGLWRWIAGDRQRIGPGRCRGQGQGARSRNSRRIVSGQRQRRPPCFRQMIGICTGLCWRPVQRKGN